MAERHSKKISSFKTCSWSAFFGTRGVKYIKSGRRSLINYNCDNDEGLFVYVSSPPPYSLRLKVKVAMSAADSPRAELEGLLGLITSATQEAMAVYEKSGHGIPSIHSTTTHPLDTEVTTLALRKAIRTLEGACEQLCTTLAPPNHTLLNVRPSISR
jgi:hypothetical protein